MGPCELFAISQPLVSDFDIANKERISACVSQNAANMGIDVANVEHSGFGRPVDL